MQIIVNTCFTHQGNGVSRMINPKLKNLVQFMVERKDGIKGSDNIDDLAVFISESMNSVCADYLQDYLQDQTTDNADKIAEKLVQAMSDYAEDQNLFAMMESEDANGSKE